MDWRLIAAVSAATGSFCFVAFGAYVVFTHNPAPQRTAAPAPMLLSEFRFPAAAPPSLLSVQPASASSSAPDPFGPGVFASASSPFAPQANAAPPAPYPPLPTAERQMGPATSGAAAAPGRIGASAQAVNPPPRQPHGAGYKSAALTPFDAAPRPEPPRPVIEMKKNSVVPELHAAPPAARYRGVLTSAEIVRIKSNLRLTPDQERAWPPVEAALAEMGRQQIALIRRGQEPRISPNDWPPGRLYAIAGPLLQTLRPDQKEAVRRLCRSLGFEGVASMI
ncbi:MAG TPA: hypothetical protein VKT99_16630 [Xanthobacteraceae bacterium]|jgi:hypothetical protein|nr:hypothetical protein [Xanthobacteraceae bacterium]